MKTPFSQNNDLEAGATTLLYPSMTESPEHRWAFIRKVYSILGFQLLLTIPVAATAYLNPAIAVFLIKNWLGWFLKNTIIITSFAVLLALMCYRKQHPLNYVLLGAFTICESLLVGVSCAFTSGGFGGCDSNCSGIIMILLQIYLPLGKTSHMIYGIVGILILCGYIIYDIDELIKRYGYDEYILEAIDLYLDLINLFLKLVELMKDAESADD